MELSAINEMARQSLVNTLIAVNDDGSFNKRRTVYVAKTFPDVLLDFVRLLIEQATSEARAVMEPPNCDHAKAARQQLRPFIMFSILLGKAPQISSLMYSYFETSSFQPLPEQVFLLKNNQKGSKTLVYYPGFDDELVKEILIAYIKYLSFNPKWFSSVWNWSELGRFIASHPNQDIRYMAACCLSIITRPSRHQHISFLRDLIPSNELLIELQIKNRYIFENTFRPVIETRTIEKVEDYRQSYGATLDAYAYCPESLAKITNILLLKRDMDQESSAILQIKCDETIANYIPVNALGDSISRIAYSASINKPCLIRGPTGSGKTTILDYIAAHTNRVNPPDYVKVQIGDQIDSKLLVGSYVCTEIPGQFEWQAGPLAQAMAYGSWIVFEDIDSAPSEMAQVIHSVIENGNLSCVSYCPVKMDSPHPDFRIFFTQRTRRSGEPEALKLGFGFVERLCDIVDMPELNDQELKEVLDKKYALGTLKSTILQLYRTAEKSLNTIEIARSSRDITLRDLFKFCNRIRSRNVQPTKGKYSMTDLDGILLDAIDCFLSFLPKDHLVTPASLLGEILNKPTNEVENVLLQRRPEVREKGSSLTVGRATLDAASTENDMTLRSRSNLAHTLSSLQLLETVSLCIKYREPALLVGETGVGKTTIIQYLANLMKTQLVVINLSQQSDSADLLGGYRPVEMRDVIAPLNTKFQELFRQSYDADKNRGILEKVESNFMASKKCSEWLSYLKLLGAFCSKIIKEPKQLKGQYNSWQDLASKIRKLMKRMSEDNSSPMALTFSEGSLLRAVREGKWILLDEINLAEPDVLQCLLLILDSMEESQVYLQITEQNESPIIIHPNFRVFACMNPSTDVGKRELPVGIRARFTEFFVDDVTDTHALRLIVESYVKPCLDHPKICSIVDFYKEIRERSIVLSDISGNPPVYSLRTLCRALMICAQNVCQNMEKSLCESLKITFQQQLNHTSEMQVVKMIEQIVFKSSSIERISKMEIQAPKDSHQYECVEGFLIQTSSQKKIIDEHYIITPSVKKNLQSLSRIISLGQRKLPILIQGNTSVGKTSLITYLAKLTGNLCYRINNHEHTDLQDYVGRYVLKENGELYFQEGLLVTAMRKGYWIILDELNLAPCELLEALNRVLDDNRELFIPETRESVKAHPKFLLFATQNPPEEYAGRKLLSRAFRNRFVELHFDEIPHSELEEILHRRCRMAPQYAKKIVTVMKELQTYRRESGCFTGKSGFMTMRDLFRWGERYAIYKDTVEEGRFLDWDNWIASQGLILLEGRVRTVNEADTVKEIIEKVFKRKLDRNSIYSYDNGPAQVDPNFKHIHFTKEFEKLFVQLSTALHHKEPVLLCGQTGCGKTTACQLYAANNGQNLITYNCHLNTECSDFVGDVRPSRGVGLDKEQQIFSWMDGPLVQAMRNGSLFLLDEISLADDAVLERINSVLEPERSITLTEKDGEIVKAKGSFQIVATMNPGGDYGKKELSPALRNRFTEIYCHNTSDIAQILKIIEKSLLPALLKPKIAPHLLKVMKLFLSKYYGGQDLISLRDVLSWTEFLNKTTLIFNRSPLSIQEAIFHGASLVFFDQFGTCGHNSLNSDASQDLKAQLEENLEQSIKSKFGSSLVYYDKLPIGLIGNDNSIKIDRFILQKGSHPVEDPENFVLDSPIVQANLLKLTRALQLDKPILLEGDPGAGKTSVVTALAKLTGHSLVRINLSEQTDISDLFGSDLPDFALNESDEAPRFVWRDGPMLKAIKDDAWILLDEMNLASQSVLEGLNACFDHRGEIFIPELNKKFRVNRSISRIFACQNPYNQGAARKGLPKSFLNRFTSIYVQSHPSDDLSRILQNLYPTLPKDMVKKMITFNSEVSALFAEQGFEFNLRDLIYWCDLLTCYAETGKNKTDNPAPFEPDRFVQFVYIDRMRYVTDKAEIAEIHERIFGKPVYEPPFREVRLGEYSFMIARSILKRKARVPGHLSDLCILKYQMPYLESVAKALEFNKMPILVGETGVGKRSMVRILAGLTGNNLNIMGANREMDTMELLGSYEQKGVQREMVDLIEDASKFVCLLINTTSSKSIDPSWAQLYKHIWSTLFATSIRDNKISRSEMMEAYRFQVQKMEELIGILQPQSIHCTDLKCKELQRRISRLKQKLLYQSESMYSSGNFEWVDSALIKAIKEGSWLMIENANLMNPATLDRLNSLVEPNGTLSLNEKGSGRDGIEILKPHPDFRLILTMDPDHGELSRAMRNRGVEIYVRAQFYFEDFLVLLNQNGFEPQENKACMTYCIMQSSYDAHLKITEEEPEKDGALLAHFGLNYLTTLAHQIRRGVPVNRVLSELLLSYYHQRGFLTSRENEELSKFVVSKMEEYGKIYQVDLEDDRYKWHGFIHDLVSMTGGDATVSILAREYKLFWDRLDPIQSGVLRPDEMVDHLDVVNSCLTVKIFFEMSCHGDLEHRKSMVKETFSSIPSMMEIVNNQVESLLTECVPLIGDPMPRSELATVGEMFVDTRNSPDIHYYLRCIDYKGTIQREEMQNRWLLSLHRITIKMISELIEERSLQDGSTSLWAHSQRVVNGEMLKEDLIRPQAVIASDLYDFLNGILRVVSDRCYNNQAVTKMLARFFWIGYLMCKLKRGHSRAQLIALCNQIPMLWALTYQKVIVPMIQDCDLADLSYNNRKFSNRIKHICDLLDVNITKPSKIEKAFFNKVVNMHATTVKRCETVNREIDKFFTALLGRYTLRSQAQLRSEQNLDTMAASGFIWSNSYYLSPMYGFEDRLLIIENSDDSFEAQEEVRVNLSDLTTSFEEKKNDYYAHETKLNRHPNYRYNCISFNRRRNALDQFSPIWQLRFVQTRLSNLIPDIPNPRHCKELLQHSLANINGLIVSPRYYYTLIKFLSVLETRIAQQTALDDEDSIIQPSKILKQNADMYSAFLVDHLLENIVLDNQIVGWTKLRVTTCDLDSNAPLVPEYSPILSLVSSYCLDIAHLKLNSHQTSNAQLDSLILYLWRAYSQIKFDTSRDCRDINLARNLIHLRTLSNGHRDVVGNHQCEQTGQCSCVDAYNRRRAPESYLENMALIREKADCEDVDIIEKAVQLIYFGAYNFIEYAPIFTLDPSLRSREKLEVYKSELAHIKLDLHQRNTLYYWKTGENLQLVEATPDDAILYPFPIRVLVERRAKLEKSIAKLRKEYTNRPKSDDGSLYYELQKEVLINNGRNTTNINSLINDLRNYLSSTVSARPAKLANLVIKCRMLIKNFERSITQFKSDYILYSDLTTNHLAGLCFALQGMRRLYSRLEQKMQLQQLGLGHCLVDRFSADMIKLFSFSDFTIGSLESVNAKRKLYPMLSRLCPEDKTSYIQSLLLRSELIQLNQHIVLTPSDIKQCIPLVWNIADMFHRAWLERKKFLEEQRKKQEELYQYKASTTNIGNEVSYEQREFIHICKNFPTYDHIYKEHISTPVTSSDKENLGTEEKIVNLSRSVDLSMCIDICRAHYKFMKEASLNLLAQRESSQQAEPRPIEMIQLLKLEAEILYTIVRKCAPNFDSKFDTLSVECHMLQANELIKILRQTHPEQFQLGSLKSSIEILDEDIFNIYHNPNAYEALKFQDLLSKVDDRIRAIRNQPAHDFEGHPTLYEISKLTERISSFLITDPMMKFVTGAHTLLQKIEGWNQTLTKDFRMTAEADELVELIKSWREIEVKSWRSSLHHVKRKYIDDTLCDLWFRLYEMFSDPVGSTTRLLRSKDGVDEDFEISVDESVYLYIGFAELIKNFFEEATLGDYQIRLDLVFSFAIQTRFATPQNRDRFKKELKLVESKLQVDFQKLTTYVFNVYKQYEGLLEPLKGILDSEEANLSKELNEEIRIVAWQGRNLWEIKNNFRISHRKLNKVMRKYLEILRRPLPGIKPQNLLSEVKSTSLVSESDLSSTKLAAVLEQSLRNIERVDQPILEKSPMTIIDRISGVIPKLRRLNQQINAMTKPRYSRVLESIEETYRSNADSIESFHSHKVHELVIKPKDCKETKSEKMKQCRQMYNSKKFNMQSVFKNLQQIGASYQRGLNCSEALDANILSLEPLRGMIQHQSRAVLKAASGLVDDSLVISCNQMYRKLVTENQVLLAQGRGADLTGDQDERIRGFAYDMVLDIVINNRNAAMIYRHLMSIQAATTRLKQLQTSCGEDEVVVYNFARVHNSVKRFNELVSRAFSALSKLEIMMDCFENCEKLEAMENHSGPERVVLGKLITEIDVGSSLMTRQQYGHIKQTLSSVRKDITLVSYELRDKLKNTIKTHLYSDDNIKQIQDLYLQFYNTFSQLVPEQNELLNFEPGTVLSSIKTILNEAEQNIRPILEIKYLRGRHEQVLDLESHPNIDKLSIRLHKLVRQAKLATQAVHQDEARFVQSKHATEAERRKLKPFNQVDSTSIRDSLRLSLMDKFTANCFMTLNNEQKCCNIEPLVRALTPVLYIYVENVASYLNVILNILRLKLITANLIVPFFTDLVLNGFGLPCKIQDLDDSTQDNGSGKLTEDNTGFGEGEGKEDVSRKLEFESQLDDLKRDEEGKENEDNSGQEKDEHIDAHDDGVEMSEDIDAKAEGPEGDTEQSDNEGHDENADQERLDELDKEMDSVDEDEGKLDQNLWGDDGNPPPGEDDEEDLRQTDMDGSIKPEMNQTDIQSHDHDLADAKEPGIKNEADEEKMDAKPELDKEIDQTPAGDDADNQQDALDMEEEAAQALEPDPDYIGDMSQMAEDIQSNDPGNENDAGEEPLQDDPELEDAAEMNTEQTEEVDMKPEDDKGDISMDISDISSRGSPFAKMDDVSAEGGQEKDKGRGKSNDERDESQEQGEGGNTQVQEEEKEVEGEKVAKRDESKGGETQQEQDSAEKLTKRTLAERSSIDQSDSKRRKIDEAVADQEDKSETTEKLGQSDSVRHLEKDTSTAIEVIDLANSDDDFLQNIDEELEQRQSSRIANNKPAELEAVKGDERIEDGEAKQISTGDSTYNTNLGLLKYISHGLVDEGDADGIGDLMKRIDNELNRKSNAEHECLDADNLTGIWLECTRSIGHLVHELCQQLQIVLQPTKMSKYKGDYKSGKRLHMRKIISYIASHYRKDKIWMRRTKPCKRTYNISLAVDNSKSMSENNCRQMTYQSLALLAKSLSLIDAGSLNIVSFGEQVKCIHEFGQPYMDAIGAQWLKGLSFSESRTSYKEVLRHSCESFARQAQATRSQLDTRTSVNQLLILISDGRNVSSEREEVKCYLRQLKSMGVLTLFVIIDDLRQNGGKSIVDVKACARLAGSPVIENYMDQFPFPFYVLLRRLETMPSVLGDALRQWFELVSGSN